MGVWLLFSPGCSIYESPRELESFPKFPSGSWGVWLCVMPCCCGVQQKPSRKVTVTPAFLIRSWEALVGSWWSNLGSSILSRCNIVAGNMAVWLKTAFPRLLCSGLGHVMRELLAEVRGVISWAGPQRIGRVIPSPLPVLSTFPMLEGDDRHWSSFPRRRDGPVAIEDVSWPNSPELLIVTCERNQLLLRFPKG